MKAFFCQLNRQAEEYLSMSKLNNKNDHAESKRSEFESHKGTTPGPGNGLKRDLFV